jgi:hypothetical protein
MPMVRLLLKYEIDIDRNNYHGIIPLIIASACAEIALAIFNKSDMPSHRLQLKIDTIYSIIHNLSIEKDLIKSARIRILELRRHIVRVKFLYSATSFFDDRSIYLPRINFNFHPQLLFPSDTA